MIHVHLLLALPLPDSHFLLVPPSADVSTYEFEGSQLIVGEVYDMKLNVLDEEGKPFVGVTSIGLQADPMV